MMYIEVETTFVQPSCTDNETIALQEANKYRYYVNTDVMIMSLRTGALAPVTYNETLPTLPEKYNLKHVKCTTHIETF